jgi:large subunit ribosomal protein L35
LAKYKIKTHSGARGRFTVSGTGRILRRKSHINNYRRKKRGQTLRTFADKLPVAPGHEKRLRRLMPYSRK